MEVKGDQQMGSPSQNASFGWLQSVSPDLCWLFGLTFSSSSDTISTYYKSADGKKYVFLIFHREPGMLGTGK